MGGDGRHGYTAGDSRSGASGSPGATAPERRTVLSRPLRRTPSLVLAVLIALALPAIAAQPKPSAKPLPAAPTAPAARTALAQSMTAKIEAEGAGYDFGAYRAAPPGFRIWCGPTIETADLDAFFPWLDWAYRTAGV